MDASGWPRIAGGWPRIAGRGPDIPAARNEVHFVQKAWVTVVAAEARTYEELLSAVTMVSNFIALGVGQPIRLIETKASAIDSDSKETPQKTIDFAIRENSDPVAPMLPDIAAARMLFTLGDVRGDLEHRLHSWCNQQDKIKPLYSLYFGTLRRPKLYVEQRLVNMFQALESFDRRNYTIPAEQLVKHAARVARIMEAVVTNGDRDWLEDRIRNSSESSAKDRILRLVKEYDAGWIFENESAEIDLAANFRNFYTHYTPKLEEKLPPKEERSLAMHRLAVRLQILCEIILLREIGFHPEELKNKYQETGRMEWRLGI